MIRRIGRVVTGPAPRVGPTEAIDGRLEHLRGSVFGFRNLTNYIARSLLDTGASDRDYTLHCEEPDFCRIPHYSLASHKGPRQSTYDVLKVGTAKKDGASRRRTSLRTTPREDVQATSDMSAGDFGN